MTLEERAKLRKIAEAATPGPWQWFGNTKMHEVYLATPDRGRLLVMDFARWGMGGAQPRFQVRIDDVPGSGIMRDLGELAVAAANASPCAKSKRGVVIYSRKTNVDIESNDWNWAGRFTIHGNAHNSPPWPYECDGTDACKANCSRVAVHAEQRAILQSGAGVFPRWPNFLQTGVKVETHLVHVKTVDGKLVPSPKGPSCDECSKLIVETGVDYIWLYETEGAWNCYSAYEFHRITLRNCGLHIHI